MMMYMLHYRVLGEITEILVNFADETHNSSQKLLLKCRQNVKKTAINDISTLFRTPNKNLCLMSKKRAYSVTTGQSNGCNKN